MRPMTEKERIQGRMPAGTLMLVPLLHSPGEALHLVHDDGSSEVIASTNKWSIGRSYGFIRGRYMKGIQILEREELVLYIRKMRVGPVFEAILSGSLSPKEAARPVHNPTDGLRAHWYPNSEGPAPGHP